MLKNFKKQLGLTFLSVLFFLGLTAATTLLLLKIGPIYYNNSKLVSILESIKNTPNISYKSNQDIRSILDKYFTMNTLDPIDKDDISITSHPGFVKVDIQYERIQYLFGNISILINFHEGFESDSR